ncbi:MULTISPECIES: hypothetical protein [unclassified Nocardiopsis]|uniref:hypothetical protein n=1 Tax=unclassified Nocardiopsis TaxID=2649073 RepID=UPI00066A787F|nr:MULTISPECIES: hypothetical protein [unclassified Nocardiopsis]MBQ1080521.1 hypothetical protein [Nocardiopsis sp. B62]
MFAWPALGVLISIAVPVAIIFLVLAIFRIVQRQAEKAVRSPDYWDQVPDGRTDEDEDRGRTGEDR